MFVIISFMAWIEDFFFWLWLPWNQEIDVFIVPMTTVAKRKVSSAYFRELMWASIPWEFQPKATIIPLEKMSLPAPLFPVGMAMFPSNGFVTTKKWAKILWLSDI